LSLGFLSSWCSWTTDGTWRNGYPLSLGVFQNSSLHWRSFFVTETSLWTPCPYFFFRSNSYWRHLMSCRSLICSQTSWFQNCTHVGYFIHFLVCILISYKIGFHVLTPSFLIHYPLETLNHHSIHIVLWILIFFLFWSIFQLKL
jgi:hypothetical protein